MRAVIFVNGVVQEYADLAAWLRPDDYLICADGGSRHCAAVGLRPQVVVGDLDSAEPALIAQWIAAGTQLERHPAAKDQTDLELALERALSDGAAEILLLGALGGRLDQTLANLLIVAQRDWPATIQLAEGRQLAQVMYGDETLALAYPAGATVSAIPLSPQVTGICYTGLRYTLQDATLDFGSTRGISNVLDAPPGQISIADGVLLVVVDPGRP